MVNQPKPKTRPQIRMDMPLFTFLLFPVVMNFLSPYVIIDRAFQGIVAGSFLVFGGLFISSLFSGRLWCSWACPAPETEKCTNCQKCTRNCPMSLDVNATVQAGKMENAECILCGKGIDNCRKSVIHYAFKPGQSWAIAKIYSPIKDSA